MKKSLLALGIAFTSLNAVATERPTMEAFLGVDVTEWDDPRDIDSELGVDLGAGVNLNENWALEAWYARTNSEFDNSSTDVLVETLSLNALRYLKEGETRPFFTAGVSHLMIDPEGAGSFSDNTFDLGLGVKHYFDNNTIIRGELIGRIFENSDDDFEVDPTIRFSIGYAFGGKSSSPKKSKPAPVAAPVTAPAPPSDADNDGVIDANDQCPDTATTLKVDANGCPLTLSETVTIDLNIQFPNNSDEIQSAYLKEIENVASFMNQYEGTAVEIRGYTDDRGAASYNQQLSEKRASAVAAKLVEEFGIAQNRVTFKGFGEENPIADNSTAEGRAENRRVVAEVSTTIEKQIEK